MYKPIMKLIDGMENIHILSIGGKNKEWKFLSFTFVIELEQLENWRATNWRLERNSIRLIERKCRQINAG